jgi:hypothetical protein
MRKFKVTLTTNNNSGPFDIYYVSNNESVLAPLVTGSYATNITANQLLSGVDIQADYGVNNINVFNLKDTCNNVASLPQTPEINPFECIAYLVKNNSTSSVTIQYTDCFGNIQTITIGPGDSGSFSGILDSPVVISGDPNAVIIYPDPQYCNFYNISNLCPDIFVDIKYVDCDGKRISISIPPNTTTLVKGISGTLYNSGGNCGIDPSIIPTTDPNAPQGECTIYKAVNKCDNTNIIVKYTDCENEVQTLDLPAGSTQTFTSLFDKYECISGDCSCLSVVTQTSTCGFDFSIASYTPPVPTIPKPIYVLTPRNLQYTVEEGKELTIDVSTTNVNSGTTLYWGVIFNASNFPAVLGDLDTSSEGNTSTGTITTDANGKASFKIKAKADNITDAAEFETLNVGLYPNSSRNPSEELTRTKTISIEDKSLTPPIKIYEVIATDPNIYFYSYTGNQVSIPPYIPCSPNTTLGQDRGFFFSRSANHKYDYFKNAVRQSSVAMASVAFAPSAFPHRTVPGLNPSTTSMRFTSSAYRTSLSPEITFSGGDQRTYPINQSILTFDNIITNSEPIPAAAFQTLTVRNGKMRAYYVSRTSTYSISGSIPFIFKGDDTQDNQGFPFFEEDQAGPSVFRIAGVLEKSTTPNNELSWQYITHTTGSLITNAYDQNKDSKFKYNQQESTIWFDNKMDSDVQIRLAFQSSVILTAGEFVRFTLYWIDLCGAFYGLNVDGRASKSLTWSIGPNSRFEIKDNQTY